MKQGILLIAVGSGIYARWAVNQAISVKFHNPDLPITLATDANVDSYLKPKERALFDVVTIVKPEHLHDAAGKFAPGKLKLYMNEYSDYDETIYLDVDGMTIRPLAPLFELCAGNDVASQVCSIVTETATSWRCQWMSLDEVRKRYTLPEAYKLQEINASFFYFKRIEAADKFFKTAQSCYIEGYKTFWGNSFPDELAFNVAGVIAGVDLQVPETGDNEPVIFLVKNPAQVDNPKTFVIGLYAGMSRPFRITYSIYDRYMKQYIKAVLKETREVQVNSMMNAKWIHNKT